MSYIQIWYIDDDLISNYAFINKQKLHGYFLSVFWTGNMKHGEFAVISWMRGTHEFHENGMYVFKIWYGWSVKMIIGTSDICKNSHIPVIKMSLSQ